MALEEKNRWQTADRTRSRAAAAANADRGTRSAERGTLVSTQRTAVRMPARSSFSIQHSAFRRAFTLVELLVAIIIIAILAGLFLGALGRAQQAANTANTQALIAKLHGQLMLRYESYRTRRLPINVTQWDPWLTANGVPLPPPLPTLPANAAQDEALGTMTTRHAAAHRLAALREIMRMELPDRYSDITDPPVVFRYAPEPELSFTHRPHSKMNPNEYVAQTAVNLSYGRRLRYDASSNPLYTQTNEDAECLYMIITTGLSDDTVASEQISPANVGDTDGDGMPEFIDAWGNPIHFLRWAPGFVSDLQPDDTIKADTANSYSANGTDRRFVMQRHDQFDPLKLQAQPARNLVNTPYFYEAGFALYPLIYSAGPDRITDICHGPTDAQGNPPTSPLFSYSAQTGFSTLDISKLPGATFDQYTYAHTFPYNPYQTVSYRGAPLQIGAPADDNGDGDPNGSDDNIHNHLIGQ